MLQGLSFTLQSSLLGGELALVTTSGGQAVQDREEGDRKDPYYKRTLSLCSSPVAGIFTFSSLSISNLSSFHLFHENSKSFDLCIASPEWLQGKQTSASFTMSRQQAK